MKYKNYLKNEILLHLTFDAETILSQRTFLWPISCLLTTKVELLQEGIFFLILLFAIDVLIMKKLEIEKTKPTFTILVLKVEY